MKKKVIVLILCAAVCAVAVAQNTAGLETDKKGTITDYYGYDTVITIPAIIDGVKITAIGAKAFEYQKRITSVTIPNSVTDIGEYAFSDCGVNSVTIGGGVTSIGEMAFSGCDHLIRVTFNGTISEGGFDPSAFGRETGEFGGYLGDLRDKYLANGPGTYTRTENDETWTKSGEKEEGTELIAGNVKTDTGKSLGFKLIIGIACIVLAAAIVLIVKKTRK